MTPKPDFQQAAEKYAVHQSNKSYQCPACAEQTFWPVGKDDFIAGAEHGYGLGKAEEFPGIKNLVKSLQESNDYMMKQDDVINELKQQLAERDAEIERLKEALETYAQKYGREAIKHDQLLTQLADAEKALKFYAELTNWNYDKIERCDYNGVSGGKRARTYFAKYKECK